MTTTPPRRVRLDSIRFDWFVFALPGVLHRRADRGGGRGGDAVPDDAPDSPGDAPRRGGEGLLGRRRAGPGAGERDGGAPPGTRRQRRREGQVCVCV